MGATNSPGAQRLANGSARRDLRLGFGPARTQGRDRDRLRRRGELAGRGGEAGCALTSRGDVISHTSIPGTEAAVTARLRGFPLPLEIAAGRGSDGTPEFVLGLGDASVGAALHPKAHSRTRPPGRPPYGARRRHSQRHLQFPTLIGLLEGVGLTEAPPLSKLRPLPALAEHISGGGQHLGGGVERFRIVLAGPALDTPAASAAAAQRAHRARGRSPVEDRAPAGDAIDAVGRERRFAVRFDRVAAEDRVAVAGREETVDRPSARLLPACEPARGSSRARRSSPHSRTARRRPASLPKARR